MPVSIFHRRCVILCLLLVAGLSALSIRLVTLQLVERRTYAEEANRSYTRKLVLPARRGFIVDRNEEILARNLPMTSVFADKYHLQDPRLAALGLAHDRASRSEGWSTLDEAGRRKRVMAERKLILNELEPHEIIDKNLALSIGLLARPMGLRRDELRQLIEGSDKMDVPLVKDLPEDTADQLEAVVDGHWIQGFRFERALRRWYTAPKLATHVIGFTDINNCGRFGVEYGMDHYLAGRDGYRVLKRDPRGLLMPAHAGRLMPPRSGLNVQLTLDMGIQTIVEEELDAGLARFKSGRGTVIILEPNTGEVLAMASRPHFDLNLRDNLDEASMNYAIQAIYEPGSTFKIIAAAGALDAGLVRPLTPVYCHNGHFQEGDISLDDHHPYGTLTVEGVIQKSSNIGAFKLARQVGHTRFFQYARRFGFGRKTEIQMSGESCGNLTDTGNAVDFSRVAYGYAVSVTPLQVACAYAAIANGGKAMRPHVVRQVVANDGTVVERMEPEVVCQALKPATAAAMRKMLAMVVDAKGTAAQAKVPGFQPGGKTGTAVRYNPKTRRYESGHYTVSFAGLMPAEKPAFVCVVVIDDPLTTEVTRYGGTIAAPVFAKIAERVARHMNLEPTEPIEEDGKGQPLAEARKP